MRIIFFLLLISCVSFGDPLPGSLAAYQKDLKKVNKSIEVTKDKIEHLKAFGFLPDLYFSLAELYLDKSKVVYLITQIKAKDKPVDEIDFSEAKQVKAEAIETYKSIENRFPTYHLLDKILFFMAHELKDLGELDQANATYKKIVDNYKQSRYWEESQVNLGNFFFDKKDFEFALKQYQKVTERPFTPASLLAYYKMGWCYINKGQWKNALDSFGHVYKSEALQDMKGAPEELSKMDVREEALVASVWPFVELESSEIKAHPEFVNALKYYRGASFDKGSFRRVLGRLGHRLVIKKRNAEAAEVYFELLRLADDAGTKKDAIEDYFTAMKVSKSDYYPQHVSKEMTLGLKLISESELSKDLNKYEPLLRDVATYWHKTAMATKRPEDFVTSLESYKDYFWMYPNSKYSYEMNVNLAEVYYHLDKKVESGFVYYQLAQGRKATDNKSKDLLSSSIQAFVEAFKEEDKLTVLERTQGRNGLRNVGGSYLKLYPQDKGAPTIEFNIAKSYYDERNFKKASTELRKFIQVHPRHENTKTASLLLLDCFYLQEKTAELVAEGKSLASNPNLSSEIKQSVADVIKQAQFKKVKSVAGDFGSKQYVTQFLQFAKNNKGSELGESSLFEAFTASKAKGDYEALKIGETYMATYAQSPKAKVVLNTMIQMTLSIPNYPKAAFYLQSFYERFPQEATRNDYGKQALALYEQLYDNEKLASFSQQMKNYEKAAKAYYQMQNWKQLNTVAAQVPGVMGQYYQGLSLWRMGQKNEALSLLNRAASSGGGSNEEKMMSAHAGYIVAQESFHQFDSFSKNAQLSPEIIKQKAAMFQELDRKLQSIVSLGAGRWTIASLYLLGKSNKSFANFFESGQPPAGLTADQFRKAVQPQVSSYMQNAKSFFSNCIKSANDYEILSRFTQACLGSGQQEVSENGETYPYFTRSGFSDDLDANTKSALLKNSKDTAALKKLIAAVIQREDYSQAYLLDQKLLENNPNDSSASVEMGMLLMKMNQYDEALGNFHESVKPTAKRSAASAVDKKAYWGLAALYKHFDLTTKFNQAQAEAKAQGQPRGYVHPWARNL